MKILVVDDDAARAASVSRGLTQEGHVVDRAATAPDGLFLAGSRDYDLLIVDRLLPGLDGHAVVASMRKSGIQTPVLFLTTRSTAEDRTAGPQAGSNEYLVKPFAVAELLARVAALGRRPRETAPGGTLRLGELELDYGARRVTRAGRVIELQPREFRLLDYLMRHAGQVITRTMLLQHVWDFSFDPQTNVVERLVSRLRGKIDQGFETELIHKVRGSGYCLRTPAPESER